jgi:predicted O-methyltransferase YrrM
MKYLEEIQQRGRTEDCDLSDHLETLYRQAYEMSPKVIVELGVSSGQSSKTFDRVSRELGSIIFGCDVEPTIGFSYSDICNGNFVQMDDIQFSRLYASNVGRPIDVLFIDTSHLYEHTVQEIAHWFPLLADKAVVMFHDTNMNGKNYVRKNGSIGLNWDNKRGVIRAIEEYFGVTMDESKDFTILVNKDGLRWRVKHEEGCNGLTSCFKNH